MDARRDRLWSHLQKLASSPRPAESRELQEARRYVAAHLESAGWQVRPHRFSAESDAGTVQEGVNLLVQHREHPMDGRPRFILGAHLDSIPGSPGADDNASAVAALLELARVLPDRWPENPRLDLELVVFDLEESGILGGAEHARLMRRDRVDVGGMVSLEMLGYCDQTPGSQSLPRSLVGQYPDVGNFIAVIGNQNSTRLIERFCSGMKRVEDLPVEWLQVPANGTYLQATRLSDHSPFWDAGYPALMITDTSFLRNPYYHTPRDTIDTLDVDFLTRVTQGCIEGVRSVLAEGL